MQNSILKDPAICSDLTSRLKRLLNGRTMRFMEVCGTHTVSIFQSGLRSLLPENVIHVSGPGCPVCVTHDGEVDAFLKLARRKNVLLATFGDLMRVPGSDGISLKQVRAEGSRVQIVYSPLDALELARKNPTLEIVFPGIGFETTAPTVAAAILTASREGIGNFSVLSFHKLVAPAINSLLKLNESSIDAFLLPGHVATITGLQPFKFISETYHKPCAISGFEPADIVAALICTAKGLTEGNPGLDNAYQRAVNRAGNVRAQELMNEVFEICDARWRGLDLIPSSGLAIREKYSAYDAMRKFSIEVSAIARNSACKCGDVLQGKILPAECPLFAKKCTPANPVGPCMVSTEGSCAAYYKYGES